MPETINWHRIEEGGQKTFPGLHAAREQAFIALKRSLSVCKWSSPPISCTLAHIRLKMRHFWEKAVTFCGNLYFGIFIWSLDRKKLDTFWNTFLLVCTYSLFLRKEETGKKTTRIHLQITTWEIIFYL